MNPWVLFLPFLIGLPFALLWWEGRRERARLLHEAQALALANDEAVTFTAPPCECGLLPIWHPSMQWQTFKPGGEMWHHSRDRCQPAREVIDQWGG